MNVLRRLGHSVEVASEWSGHIAKWLVPVLVVAIVYEVLVRYLFNAPTNWSYIVGYMLGTCVIALGLPHVYLHRGNVRVDVIYSKLPEAARQWMDLVLTAILSLPMLALLLVMFTSDTVTSYKLQEVATESTWYPKLWPFKTVLSLTFLLLFAEAIVRFARDIQSALGKGREHAES